MPDSQAKPAARNSLYKIALIPVLVVVLMVVVWPSSDEDLEPEIGLSDEAQQALAEITEARENGERATAQKGSGDNAARPLPDLSLHEILKHNPFELPDELDPEPDVDVAVELEKAALQKAESDKQAQLDELVATLRQNGVNMIFESEAGRSALVGTKVVTEGDMLTENLRVLRIDDTGIVLSVVEGDPSAR